MYASEATVRILAKNVNARLATEMIAAVASGVDDEIDATLAEVYDWPALATDPVQQTIQSIANLMTAGRLEHGAYAQVEGDSDQKITYGRTLELQGIKKLNMVREGKAYVPGIDRTIPVVGAPTTVVGFSPSSGSLAPTSRFNCSNRRRW